MTRPPPYRQLENATGYRLESRFPNVFAMVKDLVHVMGVARTQASSTAAPRSSLY
jgi:hypothetical protein